jgi:glycosyltransferase involved in cell wall biosynthesis
MRVIIVTDYAFVNGGAGKVALESARELANHVDEVHIFAAIGEAALFLTDAPNLKVTSLGQQTVKDQEATRAVIDALWNKPAQSAFRALLADYDPADTVIHVHSWRDALTLSIMPEIYERGFKFVFTGHDYGLACPTAGFYNHKTKEICTLRALSKECLSCSCSGGSFLKKEWFALRHALQPHRAKVPQKLKHLITVGPLSERILKPYLAEGTQMHHVPNPIHITPRDRVEVEKNEGYAYVGRFSPEKAPILAASAARKMDVPITFVGSGQLVDDIREANPDAMMRGWREPEEVREILQSVRALIFPSVWYEVQGMVVDEAIAMGVPVICSDACAGADTVTRLGGGSVFRSGDEGALCRRIAEFEMDSVLQDFSCTGYKNYWANPHTMELHIQRLLETYSVVLAD